MQSLALKAHDILVPQLATIVDVQEETGDVKRFRLVLAHQHNNAATFAFRPGQCAMLSVLGVGEVMISITSTPTRPEYLEFAIKKAGTVTSALHTLRSGSQVGIRGPYGNSFPVEQFAGKDLLFIGGGIGLAPLRSVINYVLDNRNHYGSIDIIYGARTPSDLVFRHELCEVWPKAVDTAVHLTVDQGDTSWSGPVGFVPTFLEQLAPQAANKIAITCGPPIMIKFVLAALSRLGFSDEQIVTTLEMKMKCGVGKCGRCNIGSKYVCVDGPVFTLAELRQLPQDF